MAGQERNQATGITVEVAADDRDYAELERALSAIEDPGVYLHEVAPHRHELRSDIVHTIVIFVTSAGGAKIVRDLVVSYLESRRIRVVVKQGKAGTTVEYEGPLAGQKEIARLAEHITLEDPPRSIES